MVSYTKQNENDLFPDRMSTISIIFVLDPTTIRLSFQIIFLAESWIHDIDSPYPGKNFNLGSKFDFVGKKKAEIPFVEERRLGAEWEQVHFNVGPQLVQTSQKHHKKHP